MNLILRPGKPADANACATICYEAFKTIAEAHNFPPDIPSSEVAATFLNWMFSHPGFYTVVAELDGKIIGSNVLDERNSIAGVGPITVDPAVQNKTAGRQLMEDVLDRCARKKAPGVRLVQAAYHNRSLSLYTKFGFVVREPLVCLQSPHVGQASHLSHSTTAIVGQASRLSDSAAATAEPPVLSQELPGYAVRPAAETDLAACNRVCRRVHGHDRGGELQDAIQQKTATVVEHRGHITGYATIIGFFGHAVGETNEELKALIGAAPAFAGPGFLLPARNAELFRWCLGNGLRVTQPMTLMSLGLYNEPAAAFLPSITY